MILRALRDDNAKLDRPDRVTIDSIRNHTVRHFPVQNVAKATYRRILERRAQENGVDFVKVSPPRSPRWPSTRPSRSRAMRPLSSAGLRPHNVDSGTKVDVNTGMIAAARLQARIESRASGTRIADLMAQMGHIINAIHSTVPEELWPEILRKIDGPVAADMPADEFEDWGDAEDEYDPVESAQADEDCWIQRAGRG